MRKLLIIFSLLFSGIILTAQPVVIGGRVYNQHVTNAAIFLSDMGGSGGPTSVLSVNGKPVIYTGKNNPSVADLIAGGLCGESETIPLQSEALFWLDGTVSDTLFLDQSGNDRHFSISNKDFTTSYFPYKSAALISAPVGDTILIQNDVNNFLYAASDSTPNQIPVVSFFQNIDYADKLFCRHVAQDTNSLGVETLEPHIADITLYSSSLTGADSVSAWDYYGVPAYNANIIVAPSGGDYTSINSAISAASVGNKIIVKTGRYTEAAIGYLLMNKAVTIESVGRVVVSPNNTYLIYGNAVNSGTIKGAILDGNATCAYCVFFTGANTIALENCYLKGYTNRAVYETGVGLLLTNCVVVDPGTTNNPTMELRGAFTINGCLITGATSSGRHVIYSNTGTFNCVVKHTKFNSTLSATSYPMYLAHNFTGYVKLIDNEINFTNGLGAYRIAGASMAGTVDVNYNQINFTGSNSPDIISINDAAYNYNLIGNTFSLSKSSSVILASAVGGALKYVVVRDNKIMATTCLDACLNVLDVDSVLVRGNVFHVENSDEGFGVLLGSETADHDYPALVEYNAFYGPQYYGTYLDNGRWHAAIHTYRLDGCETRYNYVQGSMLGIVYKAAGDFTSASNTIHHNILVGNRLTVKGINDVGVYNNTVICDRTIHILDSGLGESAENTVLKNNIIAEVDDVYGETMLVQIEHVGSEAGFVSDNNLFYSADNLFVGVDITHGNMNFTQWQSAGYDTNGDSLTTTQYNALFGAGYELISGSAAIGTGEDLGASFQYGLDSSTDWGTDETLPTVTLKQQTGSWDVGAYVSD